MKLFNIYKHKQTNKIIQIDSFATHMNTSKNMLVIFKNIEHINGLGFGGSPSFNGYGSADEIENEYELLVDGDDLDKYENWDDVFDLIK